MLNRGDTLLIPAPGAEETPHLWTIVTDPDPLCVVVCLSTLRYDHKDFSGNGCDDGRLVYVALRSGLARVFG
jgi:hypothetical protein